MSLRAVDAYAKSRIPQLVLRASETAAPPASVQKLRLLGLCLFSVIRHRGTEKVHSTWDDEMVDFERFDYIQYARFLDHASKADKARWLTGDTISYADEAVAMRPNLYLFPDDSGTPSEFHKISYKYTGAQRDRMREQLLKGGLRLARVLNAIFQ